MAGNDDGSGRLDSTVWLGVGLVGVFVFVVGIWRPALSRIPYSSVVGIVVAIAGAALAVVGLSYWWDGRSYELEHPRRPPLRGRAREMAIAPSFEIYDPKTARPPAPEPPESPPETRG